jgi:WD40-like Beta Propeller Repeat
MLPAMTRGALVALAMTVVLVGGAAQAADFWGFLPERSAFLSTRSGAYVLPTSTPQGMIAYEASKGRTEWIAAATLDGRRHWRITRPNRNDADSGPQWSPDGRQLAFLRTTATRLTVVVAPWAGGAPKAVASFPKQPRVRDPSVVFSWSPAGDRLAIGKGNYDCGTKLPPRIVHLYVVGSDGGDLRKLPLNAGSARGLVPVAISFISWARDGQSLLYGIDWYPPGSIECHGFYPPTSIHRGNASSNGSGRRLVRPDEPIYDGVWSPDGTRIAFTECNEMSNVCSDVATERADGTAKHVLPHSDLSLVGSGVFARIAWLSTGAIAFTTGTDWLYLDNPDHPLLRHLRGSEGAAAILGVSSDLHSIAFGAFGPPYALRVARIDTGMTSLAKLPPGLPSDAFDPAGPGEVDIYLQ